ncbi:MAG TPA: M28 family peptidase [Vicinamibacterales bacterium]|jgi:Zn-dependent M28 family amino/carboxypeptidase
MRFHIRTIVCLVVAALLVAAVPASAQLKGVQTIRAEDMKFHMQFLGATEFKGRNTPSVELEIAARYIALTAQRIGLKPLLPNGSYFQDLPLDITRLSEATSQIRLTSAASTVTYHAPAAFAVRGRWVAPAAASGGLVFLGLGANAPTLGWDDFAGVDLKGKVAIVLDATLPATHPLRQAENRAILTRRATVAREKGAVAVLTVVTRERESTLTNRDLSFDNVERGRPINTEISLGSAAQPAVFQVDLRHDAAAGLLGITRAELDLMFDRLGRGERVAPKELPGRSVDVAVNFESRKGATRNVVAVVEGSDPTLKREYVLLGAHHDGIGYREGDVFPGADDNISAVAALFSLGKALLVERPKRSVILVWYTGEEKGLYGAHYFAANSPVPIEKISAVLNLDMLSRNDPNSIYLIGSNTISKALDRTLNDVNAKVTKMTLDYKYQEPSHPDRFFFRSDHYPYLRYGVPAVWLFCGTTGDYHQPTDVEERTDYVKMEKVTKLVYHVAMEIGNRPTLLELDVDPRITSRGRQNLQIDWERAGK